MIVVDRRHIDRSIQSWQGPPSRAAPLVGLAQMARTPVTRTAPVPTPEPPGVLPVPEPGAEDRTRPATWPAAATPARRDAPNRAIAPLPAQRRAARTLSACPAHRNIDAAAMFV